ncbi:MAG TPA: hypothetical protein VLA02_15150 [Reyranella sp.]|nr:hypothetical protein [Reyranella sp.]
MTYGLALIAGIVGGGLGIALGIAAASALAAALGISSFEGASGYFAVFIGGPIGGVLGLVLGPTLVLRRAGHRSFAALGRHLAFVIVGVVAIGGAVLAGFWILRPILNSGGPPPQLVFEIRLPPSVAPTSMNGWSVELQTSRNRMPGSLDAPRQEQGRTIIPGRVEMYYRAWSRLLVVTMPDKTDLLFEVSLGLSAAHSPTFGAWQRATYIGEPGKSEARRATPADQYEIRYRAEWAGED